MSWLCIGLFGSCDITTWRQDIFIPKYLELGMVDGKDFYNPQLPPGKWKPEDAQHEAEHLANDAIVCFPVTSSSYSLGSLVETGFSILQSIRFDDRRDFIIMIDDHLINILMEDEKLSKESLRARALVKEHLRKLNFSNVYLVETLEEMLELSIKLFEVNKKLMPEKQKYNPHRKSLQRTDEC